LTMNPAGSAGEALTQVRGPSGRQSAAAIPASEAFSASRGSSSNTPSPGEESLGSGATDGDDGDDASGYWLLCAVICSGTGLYVGEGQLGDLFCMLHTSDGVCRSRTVSAATCVIWRKECMVCCVRCPAVCGRPVREGRAIAFAPHLVNSVLTSPPLVPPFPCRPTRRRLLGWCTATPIRPGRQMEMAMRLCCLCVAQSGRRTLSSPCGMGARVLKRQFP